MANSKHLAGIIGLSIIVLAISEVMNIHIWANNIPSVTYINGFILFVTGLSIIRFHNRWRGWPIIITLTGWVLLIFFGLFRMFFPEAEQLTQKNPMFTLFFALFFIVGIFLTYKAYYPEGNAKSGRKFSLLFLLIVLSILQASLLFIHKKVPQTVVFDNSLPYTEITGYKFHSETFGNADSTPVIVVHGAPALGYEYLKPLQNLSKDYRVIFYDQRGAGLSPRVDNKITIEQNLDDLNNIVEHFCNSKKVNLIGHSWGAILVAGYLSKHPEAVLQAVIVEPPYLTPEAAKAHVSSFTDMPSIWKIAPYIIAYPFVSKEDGQEGYDYALTQMSNDTKPGPPFECEGKQLPPNLFKRAGYKVYMDMQKPIMDKPESFPNIISGIAEFHGDLMLMSSECSIIGSAFQEKYHIPKLPPQTVHIKAANMGHHMITLHPEWSIQTIENFFKN